MKVLFVATVRSHIGQFHMPFIHALKEQGWQVDVACKDNSADKKGLDLSAVDNMYEVPFERSPFKKQNIAAYKALKKVIDNGNYDIIHCHTPMGATLTRLAAKSARKKGAKVIYTVHGFHFYNGASKKNWLMFYPVEKMLARDTDVLITINKEDYDLATSKKFNVGEIVEVNGVGVDLSKFSLATDEQKAEMRKELGYKPEDFIMLYAADLSVRKNQPMIFNAIAKIKDKVPNLKLWLPGQPILKAEYEQQCKELGIYDKVEIMGYRRDIEKLLAACDCVISSSRQEGLPINLIEASARGKYIISTDVRGNADVVTQSGYGELVKLNDYDAMADAILKAYKNGCPTNSNVDAINVYDEKEIVKKMFEVYNKALNS